MNSKRLLKAFIAGLTFPAVVLPLVYTMLYFNVRVVYTQHFLQFIPLFLPLTWGIANALFFYMHKGSSPRSTNNGLIVTGACLGFLVAVFGVFIAQVPAMLFGKGNLIFAPLFIVPAIYAFLFRYVVKWLNKLIGV